MLTQKIEVDGVSHRSFLRLAQKFYKVVQEIAITNTFGIDTKDKPVRKAEKDEYVELMEGPKKDEKSGLERVKVKCLKDGAQGWLSIKGNQGKIFLAPVDKPFFTCLKDVTLDQDVEGGSSVRTLKADEVLELIAGPRQETPGSVMRSRRKAVQDGKVGWFTVKDPKGTEYAEKDQTLYTCLSTVAITDVLDIKDCKVLKKLAVDETFVVTEGPVDDVGGMTRVKGKSTKDDVEGWITIKGNAGTHYAKLNEKRYKVTREIPMQQKFNTDSDVRTLAVGEAVEVLEGPKEEKFTPINRIQIRTSTDRAVGWISVKGDSVRPWTNHYKFLKAAPLYTAKGLTESVVREVAAGEALELLEGPMEIEGVMWLKGRMKSKDGAVGWTVKNNDSVRLLGV